MSKVSEATVKNPEFSNPLTLMTKLNNVFRIYK